MFTPQTEQEIINNISAAIYGGLITLTAHAYNELLTAARSYDAIRSGYNSSPSHRTDLGGATIKWEPQPGGELKPTAA